MKEAILWAGLGIIVALLLLQRFVLFKQKTAQLSVPTQDDDGVWHGVVQAVVLSSWL